MVFDPSAYGAIGVNWGVLDISIVRHARSITTGRAAAYNIQIAVIGDGGVSVTTDRKAGGGRPGAYGSVGVNWGVLDSVFDVNARIK